MRTLRAKETVHYAGDKLKEASEKLKEDTEDAIGHAKWTAEYAKLKAEEATRAKFATMKVHDIYLLSLLLVLY